MAAERSGGRAAQAIGRAWYAATIAEFLAADSELILGRLTRSSGFGIDLTQRDAWLQEISFLRSRIQGLTGALLLEFSIPRMGRRIDAVLIVGAFVFAVEFKVGETAFDRAAVNQVWDYALDLKNFHEASRNVFILPILVATEAAEVESTIFTADSDNVYRPVAATGKSFRLILDSALTRTGGALIDAEEWVRAPYHPTPTIIEAARALYAQHSVEDIARFDAGAQNLAVTSGRIEELVDLARRDGLKVICFVTGVPGAGKTLVGLNLATRRREADKTSGAVFLSGNGPLVAVLREALTRDEVARRRGKGDKVRKGTVGESVKAFIQNVHHFRDEALVDEERAPYEHVVVFDEAQRAWNLQQTANFMQRKKNRPGFSRSEPEFLVSYMDRHADWAVVVCLVGGGQEINTGEAGIDAWLEAMNSVFPGWHMHISSRLTDSEYAAGKALERLGQRQHLHLDDSLHLSVSMRSFRAENVSNFVKALLDCEADQAREIFKKCADRFPMALTRNLPRAKSWIRQHARASERYGVMASSKAQRLKPHAIDIRVNVDPIHWFLGDADDTRSSYYMEDAATEFQVQGLEVDWACVSWDADFRYIGSGWSYHDFRGDRWTNILNEQNRGYLRNAYRVLLTRARQGMVVFVPQGDGGDPTRAPDFYDATFDYLADTGIPVID